MDAELQKDFELSREHFYKFLAGIFFGPVTKGLHAIFSNCEHAEMLKGMFAAETVALFEEFRNEGPTPAVVHEFENLFRVPGPWYTTPYESVFMDTKEVAGKAVEGLLYGESAHDVERSYRKFGLKIGGSSPDLPDYIGVELSFMSHLAKLSVDPKSGFKASALIETQKAFLEKHLGRWVPQFADRLAEKAKAPYYKGVAKMLKEFLKKDLELLGGENVTSQ